MTQYLMSIYQPGTEPPPADELEAITRDLEILRGELKSAGAWVFAGGLEDPGTARVIHPGREKMPVTDGPHVEAKEFIGGINIIEAADLDEALEWGRKLARATTLPVEVRPFRGGSDAG
jgi:hypothetical protein